MAASIGRGTRKATNERRLLFLLTDEDRNLLRPAEQLFLYESAFESAR